jgi:hypothetical protein
LSTFWRNITNIITEVKVFFFETLGMINRLHGAISQTPVINIVTALTISDLENGHSFGGGNCQLCDPGEEGGLQ